MSAKNARTDSKFTFLSFIGHLLASHSNKKAKTLAGGFASVVSGFSNENSMTIRTWGNPHAMCAMYSTS
jgi:hypothetical protein